MCADLFPCFSKTAFVRRELGDDFAEILLAEIGPKDRREEELRVGDFPQQEIADAHIAARTNHQVNIRNLRMIEVLLDGGFVNIVRVQVAGGGFPRDGLGHVNNLGTAALAKG